MALESIFASQAPKPIKSLWSFELVEPDGLDEFLNTDLELVDLEALHALMVDQIVIVKNCSILTL